MPVRATTPKPPPVVFLADTRLDFPDERDLRGYLDGTRAQPEARIVQRVEAAFSSLKRRDRAVLEATFGTRWSDAQARDFPGLDACTLPVRLVMLMAKRQRLTPRKVRGWCADPVTHERDIRALKFSAFMAQTDATFAYRDALAEVRREEEKQARRQAGRLAAARLAREMATTRKG